MIKKQNAVFLISAIQKYCLRICVLFPVFLMVGKGGQCSVITDNPAKQGEHLSFLTILLFLVGTALLSLFLRILRPDKKG